MLSWEAVRHVGMLAILAVGCFVLNLAGGILLWRAWRAFKSSRRLDQILAACRRLRFGGKAGKPGA